MSWLVICAVGLLASSPSVLSIMNSTSVIVTPDGMDTYPCFQVNHKVQELDPSVLGLWYAIEIIHHREDPKVKGAQVVDRCPKLNIFKIPAKDIRINWQEKSGDINYTFQMVDPENQGFWLVWSKQTGSKSSEQFQGSVQVLEAQPSRMVLRFCAHYRSDYSVVLVRNITVPHDTQPIHNQLAGYALPVYSSSLTCRDVLGNPNSAALPLPTVVTVALTAATLLVSQLF